MENILIAENWKMVFVDHVPDTDRQMNRIAQRKRRKKKTRRKDFPHHYIRVQREKSIYQCKYLICLITSWHGHGMESKATE